MEVTETMDYWYDIVTRKEYRVKVIRRVGPHQVEDQDGKSGPGNGVGHL